jgi:hypothetical protein
MSDQVSGLIQLDFHIDQSGNLTTATPVDLPLAGDVYHKTVKMPQDGCLRAVLARCETTPNTGNPALVCSMTIAGTESTSGHADIAVGSTEQNATFANGEVTFDQGDEIGASIMQTGATIDDAVDEVHVTLVLQLGRSNI